MKTFKQFQEESEPVYSTKQFTKFGKSNYPKNTPFVVDDFIKNRAKELFKFKTGIPLAKKKFDKIATHDKPLFKSVPATGVRGDQPVSDALKRLVNPVKSSSPKNIYGV